MLTELSAAVAANVSSEAFGGKLARSRLVFLGGAAEG